MKTKGIVRLLLAGLALAAGLRAAETGLEFTGYLRDDKGVSVALKHTKSGDSRWLAIGQQFQDYTVSRLDEKMQVLVVTRGGVEFQLTLGGSSGRSGPPRAAEPLPELKRKIMNNLRQLAAAADQYYLENGKNTTTYDELVGPTKYVKKVDAVAGETYTGITFAQGKPLRVTTSGGYTIEYDP